MIFILDFRLCVIYFSPEIMKLFQSDFVTISLWTFTNLQVVLLVPRDESLVLCWLI